MVPNNGPGKGKAQGRHAFAAHGSVLSQPYNGRTTVALDLTFQWKLRNKDEFPEGTNFEYLLRVYDAVFTQITVDDYSKYYTEEAQLPFPLIPGHAHSWDIAYSKAEVCTRSPTGSQEPIGRGQLANTGSSNAVYLYYHDKPGAIARMAQ